MRLTPRQLQTTAPPPTPTPRSQWIGAKPPTTHQTPSNSAVSCNVDACTILPQPLTPLNPLSRIAEGSIDSIDRGSLGARSNRLDRSGIP